MKTSIRIVIFTLVSVISLTELGCNKPDFSKIAGVKWDPNLAAPIGFAEFDVYDVLSASDSSNLVLINQTTGEIALTYDSEIASFNGASVIPLTDVNQTFSLGLPDLGLAAGASYSLTTTASNQEKLTVPLTNGIEIHDLVFLDGDLKLDINTTLRHDIDLDIRFIDLKSNNTIVKRNIVLDYSGTTPQTATRTIDLQDVKADFTAGGTATNELRISFDATIKGTGQPIGNNEKIDIGVSLTNLAFKNATGYFGQQLLASQVDTIDIKIFNKNTTQGTFELTNPMLNFRIENSFGIPIDINFGTMKTVNTLTGEEFVLGLNNSTLSLNEPAAMGQTATTILALNKSNTTNLSTIISPTPKLFHYGISATANPAGQTSKLNFIENTSKFLLKCELRLPLEGFAYDFTLSDTIPFSLDADVNKIESAMFKLNISNGFPVSFRSNAVFLDKDYKPLFTLINGEQELISSGKINAQGKVVENVTKVSDIKLSEAQIQQLGGVKYVLLTGTAETTQPKETVVKFYDSYKISLKLAMQVKLNGNI